MYPYVSTVQVLTLYTERKDQKSRGWGGSSVKDQKQGQHSGSKELIVVI